MKKIISLILSFLMIISCLPLTALAAVSDNAYDADGKYVYRNDTYDFPMLGDPQNLPDEEFFGKWDAENEAWEVPSYFKYDTDPDLYPEMESVVKAVKAGNYSLAKQELMNYYTPKKYQLTSRNSSYSDVQYQQAEFLLRNFYAVNAQNGFPRGVAKVDSTEWQEVEVDMMTTVEATMVDKQTYATIVIMSMDKSNTPVEIMSRESGTVPTLTLVVNGTARVIPVSEDTYIQAGKYSNNNFGGENVMYAQEYGYTGHWDANNLTAEDMEKLGVQGNDWGEESTPTKRAYMKFDLSSIGASDDITSATLKFTARVSPGEEYDLTSKELAIYHWMDNNWSESGLTWNTFTDWLAFSCNEQDTWDFITTQTTTTKGKICYIHRGTGIMPLAALYEVTGDEKYAYTFLRQQMGIINSVGVTTSVLNCIDMSGYIRRWGDSFVKSWGSEHLTPEVFTAAVKNYIEMTECLKVTWMETKAYSNNYATYATYATYYMAVMFPELDLAENWMDITLSENRSLLLGGEIRNGKLHEGQVLNDGSCIELAQGYVVTLLNTYSYQLDLENLSGAEPAFDEDCIERIKLLVKNMIYQSAPGYFGFNLGDSMDYSDDKVDTLKTWYKLLLSDDPEIEYAVTGGKSGSLPDFTSISYPYGLRTFMRDGWGEDDIALAFTAKSYGSHGHKDLLSCSMWAYGQFLLTDQSYGSTLTGDIADYMKSAQQHNVVTINGGSVLTGRNRESVEEEQEINDLYNFTTYSTTFYNGADYSQRSILFLKNQKFFIVNDFIIPQEKKLENTYTQFWHMLPDSGIYITDDGKNQFRSNFTDTANVIVAGVDTDSMYDIYLADSTFSPADGAFVESKKGVYEKRLTGNASYQTVVYPVDKGADFDIKTSKIDVGIADNKAAAMWIRITDKNNGDYSDYYFYHLNDPSVKQEVEFGDYTTDATTLLIEENSKGEAVSVFIYDGTYIKSPFYADEYLFKSTEPKTLGYKLNGSSMTEISTDKLINDPDNLRTAFSEEDLKDLTIYVGTKSQGALFNTNIVSDTSKSGGYLYFGEEPIVVGTEAEEETTDNNKEDNKVSHGGGGGGGGGAAVTPPVEDEDKPGEEDVTPVTPVDPTPVTPSYDDVSEDDWYFDYVEELTEKEIVSGDGTGNFAPNSNVTREQFLKMLMIASAVDAEEAENTFEDVLDNAWYKEYVLKAKSFGIVNGISDTEFGIGENITRQDMAVMISRTIEKLGIEIERTDVAAFADDDKVSEYAKDAVTFMKSIGLIEGYNNEFRPLDNLTRAEVATIISKFLKKFEL